MKSPFVLYCCSYSKDLQRLKRLLESLQKHNVENLPIFISAPAKDIDLFSSELQDYAYTLINEEDILKKNELISFDKLYSQKGWIQQQVIKSEFWRLETSDNYLVMDSDCVFLKDFGLNDFMAEDNVPYSIINEGREILQSTELFGPNHARNNYLKDRTPIMRRMGRQGVIYDYGYAPFIWSKKVWQSLEENFLKPNNMNILDAILECSSEFTWYGESLLKYRAIPLYPRNELFKHYHYEHQLWADNVLGYTPEILKKDYLGIVFQSNLETWQDFGIPEKNFKSRLLKSLKRLIKYLIFKLKITL